MPHASRPPARPPDSRSRSHHVLVFRPARLARRHGYTCGVNDGERTLRRLRSTQAAFEAAAGRAEAKREQRNTAVRAALAAGLTHAEIARVTGLSRGRIGQIAQDRPE